ncbi:hypothetical protein C4K68_05215 [Pokkaliibacter plantistimulans]|uniref:Uncharacterized protein n=1 Tax=Proteobacteria bacterium 228 TaxID=2083153 RepID=A0A2S5KUX3_9PROT|nr:hypothetical protein [Pokkaliibacter plantistimulans]PPC78452.1 hypothetical protein C4K68_05215 [Pokkaliibacter plantistimulans]
MSETSDEFQEKLSLLDEAILTLLQQLDESNDNGVFLLLSERNACIRSMPLDLKSNKVFLLAESEKEQKFIELLRASKSDVEGKLSVLKRGKKAIKAYRSR